MSAELSFSTLWCPAFNTVWHLSLQLKLLKVLACQPMVNFIMELLYSRFFVLQNSNGQASCPFRTKRESQKDLFSPLVCTISTLQIFQKHHPSGTCMLTMLLWPSQPSHLEKRNLLYHTIYLLLTHTWRLRLSVEKTVCSVFHLKNHSANYQLNVKLQPSATVKFDAHPWYLGICLDRSVIQNTLTHTQKESLVASGTNQMTGQCHLGSFLQCSENLLPGSCICSNRGLCPSVVPQRSHKADRSTFKQVNTYYHWLPAKHTHLILAHSIWHYPIWDKAQCKALNLKHLLRETQCLCSRKHLCSQNCCQLTGNQPHQSLHPSFPHLVHYFN